MTSRTEMLHFRATPEEKAAIEGLARTAGDSLSTWMRTAALTKRQSREEMRQAIQTGLRQALIAAAPTQPAVEEMSNARALARDATLYGTNFTDVTGKRIDPTTIKPSSGAEGETYEQFMERRVGELVHGDATADEYSEAQATAKAEWRRLISPPCPEPKVT